MTTDFDVLFIRLPSINNKQVHAATSKVSGYPTIGGCGRCRAGIGILGHIPFPCFEKGPRARGNVPWGRTQLGAWRGVAGRGGAERAVSPGAAPLA